MQQHTTSSSTKPPSTTDHGGLPRREDGRTLPWTLAVYGSETAMVVAQHVQACCTVLPKLWRVCYCGRCREAEQATPPSFLCATPLSDCRAGYPKTEQGNRYMIVLQAFITKWPLVFAVLDQKAIRLTRLVAGELLPLFGVPDAILSK